MEKKTDEQFDLLIRTFTDNMSKEGFSYSERLEVVGYITTQDNKTVMRIAEHITNSGMNPSLILKYANEILEHVKQGDPDWEVTIRTTYEKTVTVKAQSRTVAIEIAKDGFDNGDCEFLPDEDDDFKCVDFDAIRRSHETFLDN